MGIKLQKNLLDLKDKNMKIRFIILLLIICGCKKDIEKLQDQDVSNDSIPVSIYYNNGKFQSKGYTNKSNLKIGKWDYFHEDGTIDKTVEYIIIKGKEYANQGWYYNKSKKDTSNAYGNFYKFVDLKQEYGVGDTVDIKIRYRRLLALSNNIMFCTSEDINADFSNIDNVKLDTIYGEDMKIQFGIILSKLPGKKNIRGFILEWYDREATKEDSITHKDRKVYVDKTFDVK